MNRPPVCVYHLLWCACESPLLSCCLLVRT